MPSQTEIITPSSSRDNHPITRRASSSHSSRKKAWRSRRTSFGRGHSLRLDAEEQESLSRQVSQSTTRSSRRRVPKWWKIRIFKGMIDDIKRRAPFYWSDWKDAWDYRVIPATVYMYFAKYVTPITNISFDTSPPYFNLSV